MRQKRKEGRVSFWQQVPHNNVWSRGPPLNILHLSSYRAYIYKPVSTRMMMMRRMYSAQELHTNCLHTIQGGLVTERMADEGNFSCATYSIILETKTRDTTHTHTHTHTHTVSGFHAACLYSKGTGTLEGRESLPGPVGSCPPEVCVCVLKEGRWVVSVCA